MTIQVDTREHEKEWKRIQRQFDKLEVDYFRSKLFVGDYMSLDNPRLIIDRKKNLQEICGNICQQHERFRKELIRAREHDIQLVILCEHGKDITCLEDVYFWENPRAYEYKWTHIDGHPMRIKTETKAVKGRTLYKTMLTISQNYNTPFFFCSPQETGQRIIEILGGI